LTSSTTHLEFSVIEHKPKTVVVEVKSKRDNLRLGIIKWYGPWRKYWFEPEPETGFEIQCLLEIAGYLEGLMQARKVKRELKKRGLIDGKTTRR